MNVYTITGFKGVWPVGTAAYAVARDRTQAAQALEKELIKAGLPQTIDPKRMLLVDTTNTHAFVLLNGDY